MKCYRKNGSDGLDAVEAPCEALDPSMKCYRKNGSDVGHLDGFPRWEQPSMKCYRKNGSDRRLLPALLIVAAPSMKCYRKNGSDSTADCGGSCRMRSLNEVLPKER